MSKGGGSQVELPDIKDYQDMLNADASTNRVDQVTPWGGVRWNNNGPDKLSYEDWLVDNPSEQVWNEAEVYNGGDSAGDIRTPGFWSGSDSQSLYDEYSTNFDSQPLDQTAEVYFSPEIQSLYDMQFEDGAYDNYANDYMANSRRLLDPVFDNQQERFEQTMANRGQPVGGELYDDSYGNMMEAQNSAYQNAAFTGTQLADSKRLTDFNKLMTAMGGTGVNVPHVDTSGPANMAMNVSMANQQNNANNSSNIWNTATGLGAAYLTSNPAWMAA